MKRAHLASWSFGALALAIVSTTPLEAQIGNRLRDAAARAAERETTRQVDRKVTNTVRCVLEDQECIKKAEAEGKTVEVTDRQGNAVAGAAAPAAAAAPASAFVNFDFVPGERVLFADDFTRDNVGDFPRRLEFVRGNMEVAEWQGERWLRGTTWPSSFAITLPETLPERFTVEMEVVPGSDGNHMNLRFSEESRQNATQHFVAVRYFQNKVNGGITTLKSVGSTGNTQNEIRAGTPFTLRIMADGKYVKVYAAGTRIANMPNAELGRTGKIEIEMPGHDNHPAYVRNIRVAAGGKKLYEALNETGRVATQGIYFDTGSDRIRPESAPTLKEIAQMLQDHASLRLTIEGHTDNVGNAAANQQLSEKRAAAVKAALVRDYSVADARLETKGLGASKPSSSNDTPEGRQQNRRVELVKG
jgi:OmpA-OmpF porin, OOP family